VNHDRQGKGDQDQRLSREHSPHCSKCAQCFGSVALV
jgi:hypothetical protein